MRGEKNTQPGTLCFKRIQRQRERRLEYIVNGNARGQEWVRDKQRAITLSVYHKSADWGVGCVSPLTQINGFSWSPGRRGWARQFIPKCQPITVLKSSAAASLCPLFPALISHLVCPRRLNTRQECSSSSGEWSRGRRGNCQGTEREWEGEEHKEETGKDSGLISVVWIGASNVAQELLTIRDLFLD